MRFEALSEQSGNCRRAADDLDDEIQILHAGEERRGSCASQSNGCCFDPAMVEQVFACGAAHTEHFIQAMQEEFNRRFKDPAAPEQMAGGEEREDWEGDWDDEKAASGWCEGATVGPAVDPVRCQDANGGRLEKDSMFETAPVPRVGNEMRWKGMDTCERGWANSKKPKQPRKGPKDL